MAKKKIVLRNDRGLITRTGRMMGHAEEFLTVRGPDGRTLPLALKASDPGAKQIAQAGTPERAPADMETFGIEDGPLAWAGDAARGMLR